MFDFGIANVRLASRLDRECGNVVWVVDFKCRCKATLWLAEDDPFYEVEQELDCSEHPDH
jgi:hypothetical protein